jgi:hypothetical protein
MSRMNDGIAQPSGLEAFDADFERAFEEMDASLETPTDGTENYDYAEEIVASAEAEFRGILNSEKERLAEKTALETKLKTLQISLKKTKNVKNHRKTDVNKKMAERRKEFKAQISEVKDRLYELELEKKGSSVNSADLASTTLGAPSKEGK